MPQTSTEKDESRRRRVKELIVSYVIGHEFTAQDVAIKCNLKSSRSASRYIDPYLEELNIERVGTGKFKVIG